MQEFESEQSPSSIGVAPKRNNTRAVKKSIRFFLCEARLRRAGALIAIHLPPKRVSLRKQMVALILNRRRIAMRSPRQTREIARGPENQTRRDREDWHPPGARFVG